MPCCGTQHKTQSETKNLVFEHLIKSKWKQRVAKLWCHHSLLLWPHGKLWGATGAGKHTVRRQQRSFGSVSFLSLSNFLPEPETSVSASSHMQVHRKSFVPSLMSNFMLLELETGGGGWDSSRCHVLYKELCWCQITAWWIFFYCSPPGLPLKSAARVAGDQCRNSSYTGCCIPGASSLLGTTSNMENNDISGEEVGELSWVSALLCGESTRECRKRFACPASGFCAMCS